MTTMASKKNVEKISEIKTVLKEKLQTLLEANISTNKISRITLDIPKIDIIKWQHYN